MNFYPEDIYQHIIASQFNAEFMANPKTAQRESQPKPAIEKPYKSNESLIDLLKPEKLQIPPISLLSAIQNRCSCRKFSNQPLTIQELSFLLWATQGVKKANKNAKYTDNLHKTVPSAGARQPFETYLIINNIEGLKKGLYRYLSLEHKLCFIRNEQNIEAELIEACIGQKFVAQGAVIFIWAAIPYRTEWRYGVNAYKIIAQETGHICQNLYLAVQAINAGTCAISAYDQKMIDKIIDVDGKNELAVYLAPVGKISS